MWAYSCCVSDGSREAIQLRERARAAARSVFLGELADLGRQRSEALQRAEDLADRIARVLPDALAAGIQLTEIGKVTGVSRPTLYTLRARYAVRPHGLHLVVIGALANGGRLASDLGDAIGEPIDEVLAQLERDGEIESRVIDIEDGDDGESPSPVTAYELTPQGVGVLENWEFDQRQYETEQEM